MDKQEAIEKIEKRKSTLNSWEELTRNRAFDEALDIVRKIDELEKPVVPQFVADFYESIEDDLEYGVYELCAQFYEDESELNDGLYWWFKCSENKPIETLVKMKLFGYEVEKEKLYTARLKLISVKKYSYINREKDEKRLFISDSDGLTDVYQTHFTQAELEELDVWNNPAFEIEEVEK